MVDVVVRSLNGLAQSIEIGDHRLTADLTFFGPLDATQRLRLAEIAERCPVQNTLQHDVIIEQRQFPGD